LPNLLSPEAAMLQHDIQQRGYAVFEHGIPNGMIDDVIEAYFSFTLAHPDPEPATMNAMLPTNMPENTIKFNLDDLSYANDAQTDWHKYRTNTPSFGKPNGYANRSFQVEVIRDLRDVQLKMIQRSSITITKAILKPCSPPTKNTIGVSCPQKYLSLKPPLSHCISELRNWF